MPVGSPLNQYGGGDMPNAANLPGLNAVARLLTPVITGMLSR